MNLKFTRQYRNDGKFNIGLRFGEETKVLGILELLNLYKDEEDRPYAKLVKEGSSEPERFDSRQLMKHRKHLCRTLEACSGEKWPMGLAYHIACFDASMEDFLPLSFDTKYDVDGLGPAQAALFSSDYRRMLALEYLEHSPEPQYINLLSYEPRKRPSIDKLPPWEEEEGRRWQGDFAAFKKAFPEIIVSWKHPALEKVY